MLVYGPTAGCNVENTPGFNVTIWNAAQWSAATSAQFAAFNVIAFGDCDSGTPCFTNPIWNTAIANEAVWAPVVTGNVFIIGSDPDYHVTNSNVPVNLIYQFATFAGSGTGTGLYIALSCFFQSAPPNTPVPILNGLGAFTVEGQEVGGTCSNAVHKISNNPALNGVTDANLSNWNCSVHEGFDSFPPSFQPLAIATDGSVTNYTAPDGTRGIPFVLARGVTFINTPTPTPSTPYNDFYVSKNLFKPDQGPVSIFVATNQYPGDCKVRIYNSAGEHIKTLEDKSLTGTFTASYNWDGRNKYSNKCASGIYLIELTLPYDHRIARLLLVR